MSKPLHYLSAALVLTMLGQAANAEELWDPYLRGVNEGLPAGALPPPGVYGILNNYWLSYSRFDNNGDKVSNTGLFAVIEVPVLLWVPGIKLLGADYAVGIAQPFDYTSSSNKLSPYSGSGNIGLYNTILIPGQLSWTLPHHLFVKTGLEIYLPDASTTMGDLVSGKIKNGGLPSGNGYTAIQPDLGFSYINGPLTLNAGFSISFPVTDDNYDGISYRSGNEFSADYSAMYAIGKWSFGLGMEQQQQLNGDKVNGVDIGNKATNLAMGPLVSYQAGSVTITGEWNHNLITKNEVAGDFFNVRLLTRF
ncbi:SphA family protein [Acidocella sp.]|uniref:SphA family protein n=1 Tax=Acidocella sp. TaxID=50710 RepID=UPI003D03C947